MGKKRNKVEIFKLEDRVLFEAGAVVQAAEAAAADQANNDAAGDGSAAAEMQSDNNQTASDELTPDNLAEMPVPPEMSGSDNADDTADADAADFAAADPESDADAIAFTDAPIAVSETSERILVVLNSSVADADSIVNDLGDNVEVLRLEAGTDALDAINDYLDEHADTKYSAIHLVSHGSEGYITLNGEKIDSTTINPADWKAIGEHLTDDADILVYGCDTAKSEEGKALVQTIANLTGADVAASIDSTGANGDWDLEYRSGLIEAATITPVSYQYCLESETPSLVVTTALDVMDDADGLTSLREALSYAASLGDSQTITFDSTVFGDGATIVLDSAKGEIELTSNITIDGDVNADGKADVTIDGDNATRIFLINSEIAVNLQNLNLINANSVDGHGGAILVNNGKASLTVDNILFDGNDAEGTLKNGGAIYAAGGTLVVSDSVFTNNTASASGGALMSNGGSMTITNTVFDGNFAGYHGGTIYSIAKLYMNGVTVMNSKGNGIYGAALELQNDSVIANSTFINNSSPHNDSLSTTIDIAKGHVQIFGSTFYTELVPFANLAAQIAVRDTATLDLVNSVVASVSGTEAFKVAEEATLNLYGVKYTGTQAAAAGSTLIADADLGKHFTLVDGKVAIATKTVNGVTHSYLMPLNSTGGATVTLTDSGSDSAPDMITIAQDGVSTAVIELVRNDLAADVFTKDQFGRERGTAKTAGSVIYTVEDPSLVVNTTLDVTNAYDGLTSLREAIAYLNQNGTLNGENTITFAESLSGETITLSSTIGNITKSMTINGDINGDGTADVTVDANKKGYFFDLATADMEFTINGLILKNSLVSASKTNGGAINLKATGITLNVTNSTFSGGSNTQQHGGAIFTNVAGAVLNIENSLFEGNSSKWCGNSVYVTGADVTVNITGSTFRNNTSSGGTEASDGGSVYITSAANATVSIRGSLFEGNSSTTKLGGLGISLNNVSGSLIEVVDCDFNNNKTTVGGGAMLVNACTGEVLIQKCDFTGNTAGKDGGALLISSANGEILIDGCTFTNNTATSAGGAIYVSAEKLLTITDSTFTGNTAGTTGGAISTTGLKNLAIENSRFIGNSATSGGGAFYNNCNNAILSFRESLFDANISAKGGAILLQSAWSSGQNYVTMVSLTVINNEATMCGGGILITNQNTTTIADSTIVGNIIRTDNPLGHYSGNTSTWGGAGIFTGSISSPGANNGQRGSLYLMHNLMVDNYMITTGADGTTTAGVKTNSDFYSGQTYQGSGENYLVANVFGAAGKITTYNKAPQAVNYIKIDGVDTNYSGVTGTDIFDASTWDVNGKVLVDSNGLVQLKDLSDNAVLNAAVNRMGYQLGSYASGTRQTYCFSVDGGNTWYTATGTLRTAGAASVYLVDQTDGVRVPYSTAGAAQYKPALMWSKADDGTITHWSTIADAKTQLESGSGEYFFAPKVQDFGDVAVNGSLILHGFNPDSGLKINLILDSATDAVTVDGMKFTGDATLTAGSSMTIENALLTGEGDLAVTNGVLTILNSTVNNFDGTITIDAANGIGQIVNSTLYGNSGTITGNDRLNILNSLVFGTENLSGYTAKYSVFDGAGTAATNTYSASADDVFGTELVWDGLILTALQVNPASTAPHVNGVYAAVNGTNLYYSNDKVNWKNFADDTAATVDDAYIIKTDGLGNTRVVMNGKAVAGAYSALKEAAVLTVTIATDVVDEYDGYISLREAILYGENGAVALNFDANGDGTMDSYRITFDVAAIAGNTEKGYTMRASADGNILIDLMYNKEGYAGALVISTADQFIIDGENQKIVLDISQGTATRNIYQTAGSLTIRNLALWGTGSNAAGELDLSKDTRILDGSSAGNGGAIIRHTGGSFLAENVLFERGNIGTSGWGGILLPNSGDASSSFIVRDSLFTNNYGQSVFCVHSGNGSAVRRLEGVTFGENNQVTQLTYHHDTGGVVYKDVLIENSHKAAKGFHTTYYTSNTIENLTVRNSSFTEDFIYVDSEGFYIDGVTAYDNTFAKNLYYSKYNRSNIPHHRLGNFTVYNNTFKSNSIFWFAGAGTNFITYDLFNSTIAGNTGTAADLHVINLRPGLAMNLFNSVIVGNKGTSGGYAVYMGDGVTLNAHGNVYDSFFCSETLTSSNSRASTLNGVVLTEAATSLGDSNTLSTVKDVFGTEDLSTVWDGKTLAISRDGAATTAGVLVGRIGNNAYYFVRDGVWHKADGTVYQVDDGTGTMVDVAFTTDAATNYGLGTKSGTVVYTTAQNTDSTTGSPDRLIGADSMIFNAGSYAMSAETPSLTVNTNLDILNPFDGLTSLREAVAYANTLSGATITFSDQVDWEAMGKTIVLTMGEIEIKNDGASTVDKFKIDGSLSYNGKSLGRITVKVPVTYAEAQANSTLTVSDHRVFNFLSADGKWDGVELGNIIVKGGYITGTVTTRPEPDSAGGAAGGAIYAGMNLTLKNVTVADSYAYYGGGIYCGCNLVMEDSYVVNNTAEYNGGGIYASRWGGSSYGMTRIENSLIAGNTAGGDGAGLYLQTSGDNGIATIANTTIAANTGKNALYYKNLSATNSLQIIGSVIAGNTASDSDLVLSGTVTDSAVRIVSSVYGTLSTANTVLTESATVSGAVYADVFGTNTLTGTDTGIYELAVTANGKAATAGTLTGSVVTGSNAHTGIVKKDFYYLDTATGKWMLNGADAGYTYDASVANYGLDVANAVILSNGLNTDAEGNAVSRLDGAKVGVFTAGAHALPAETPSLTVNTDQDILNPFDGQISLREAVATANANGGGTITFSKDVDWRTTDKTITLDGTDAEGNLLGALVIRSLKADNSGYNPITIDGSLMYGTVDCGTITVKVPVTYGEAKAANDLSTASDFRVITSSSSLTLQNMTLMGGYLASAAGGAIDHTASIGSKGNSTHLTLDNVTIADSGAKNGGALSCGTNTLTIKNSVFRNNYASQNGGAINRTSRALTLEDVTFTGNTAGSSGGAIHVWQSGLTLKGDCLFENNSAGDNGGAILVNSTNDASSLTTAAPADGSEIIFRGNTAGDNGGALWVSGPLTLNGGVTFENNTATGNGGAIYNNGPLTVRDTTFIGNTATGNGGAIHLSSGTADVINSTFYNNGANTGSAIYLADGTVNLVNSTLYSTSAGSSVEIAAGTFNAINSIVCGTVNGSLNNIRSVIGADAADIFTSTTLTADNTLEIKADSAAAYAGALVGQLDGAYYYMDNGKWFALDGTEKAAFALDADTGYGLGADATVYTAAQNVDAEGNAVSRLDGAKVGVFTAGAHALPAETPSLTVNTDQDILNPFDGQISLREALQYAADDAAAVAGGAASVFTSGFDATAKTYTINFADTVTKITVGSTLNVATNAFKTYSLIINGAIASGKVILDGGNTVTFNADGSYASHSGTGVRIMNLNNNNKVTLNDLILQNGLASSFSGGVQAESGTLNVNNSIFRYNVSSGSYNGGAALVNGSGTTNITGSLFEQNVGTGQYTQGGAFYTRGTAYISDSTFVRNWNNGLGGAIFSNGGYVHLLNSTIADNRANSGGAILLRTSSAYLINSTITGNTTVSTNNGAIGYSDGSVSDTIIVLNSIVAGNSSNDIANGNANTKISLINSVYGSVQVPAEFANLTVTGGQKYDSSTQTLSDIFETVADGKAVATVQTVNGVDHEVFALSRDGVAAQSGTLIARTTTNSGMHGTRTQYYYLDMANDNWICVTDSTVVVPFVLANTDGSYGLQTGVQEHIAKFDTATNAAFKTYHIFEDAQNVDENGDRVDRLYALKLQEKPQEIFQVGAYAFNFLPKQPIALTVDGYSVTNTYGDALVLTETKKEITVTVDDVEKTYYLDLVWKTNGTVAEDGTQIVGTYEDVISIDSVAVFEKDGENYVDVTDDFELTLPADSDLVIGKATLTVTADAKSITVGGAEPELTYTVDGLKNGDVFTGTLVRAEGTAAGVYAITLADGYTITNGTDDKSANYDFTFVGADLSIKEAASLTVTTLDDVVNDTDGVISFREAMNYALSDASLAKDGVYNITFSQSLSANYDADGDTTADSYRIALDSTLGTLFFGKKTFSIDGSIGTDRVILDGQNAMLIMSVKEGTYTIQDVVFTGGKVGGSGGAIMANTTGGMTFRNVLFTGNTGGNGGGAIYMNRGTVNIYDSEFIGNTGNAGAALYQVTGTLNVYNSVFTGNTGSTASVYSARSGASVVNFVNSVLYGNNSGPVFAVADNNATVNATFIDSIIADNGDANDNQINLNKATSTVTLINSVVLKGADQTADSIASVGTLNLYYSVTDADYSATANFNVTGGINNATFADTLEVVDGLPRVIATSAAGKNGVLVGKDSTGAFYVFGKNATGDAANWISLADSTVTAAFNVDAAGYGLGEGATVYMDNDMTAVMVETLKAKAELTFFAGTYRSPETITLVVNDATDTANTSLLTTTLREALAFCTTVGTKYNIVFANGVNNEVNLFENGDVTIYMSSGKGYSLSGQVNVTIDGSGDGKDTDADGTNNKVILDGRKNSTIATDATSNRYRIIHAGNADLTLKNMTMQYGFVYGGKIGGGAVYTDGGSLTLNNMYFTGNQTWSAVWNFTPGGAIFAKNSTVLIVDSIFTANGTTGGGGSGGGAIHHIGGTLTIQNSKFLNNTSIRAWGDAGSASLGGGAISMMNLSSFSISGSLFEGNTVAEAGGETGGGAIVVYGCATGTISDSVFTANKVNSGGGNGVGGGGAIHFNSSGTFTITGTTFENNESATGTDNQDKFRGGGAIAINRGSVVVEDSSFTGNKATNSENLATAPAGGAITVGQSGSLSVTDTLFSENTTTASGGAIAARGSVTIRNSVFIDNAADLGGGGAIYFRTGDAVCSIYSSTFYGNSAVRGGAIEYSTIMWGGAKMNLHHVTLAANTATSYGGAIAFRATAGYAYSLNIYNSLILGNTSGAEGSKVCDDLSLPVAKGALNGTIAESVIGTISEKTATFSIAASTTQIASGSTDYGLIFNGKASADYTVRFNKNYGNGVVELYLPARDILQIATTANPETDQLGNTRTPGANGKYLVGAMDKLFEVPSLVVNTTEDVVDAFDGLISLREAIAYQKADPTLGNTITFSDQIDWSTTDKTITLDGKDAEGNYLGQLSLTTEVTIDGSLMFGTVAQGIITIKVPVTYAASLADNTKTVSDFRVFNVSARATLRNMIVKGGLVQDGGGIYANAYLTLENMMVAESGATSNGGGVYIGAGVYAENVTIYNNTLTATTKNSHLAGGGGMFLQGLSYLVNCTFVGNSSQNTWVGGGALYTYNHPTYLIGCTVTGNTSANSRYAVATVNQGNPGPSIYIINSIVTGNTGKDVGTFNTNRNNIYFADSIYGTLGANAGDPNVFRKDNSRQITDATQVFGATTELLTDENGIHYIKPIAGPAGFGAKDYQILIFDKSANAMNTCAVVGYFGEDGYFYDMRGQRLLLGWFGTDLRFNNIWATADGENFSYMKETGRANNLKDRGGVWMYQGYNAAKAKADLSNDELRNLCYITADGLVQAFPEAGSVTLSRLNPAWMKTEGQPASDVFKSLFITDALVDRFGKDRENTLGAVRPDAETASLVVNTEIDRICKYDGVISLREATGTYAADGDTVTFADALTEVKLDSGLTISKNLTFSDDNMKISGAALTIADAISLTISTGSMFEITEGIVNNGTLANAGSLTLATLSGTGTLTNSGTLDVNGDFVGGTVNNTGTMILSGANNSVNAGSTLGNVTYDGADGQNVITADTYGNLVISTTGTATVAGDIKATSTTVNSGATLKTEGAFNGGAVTNAGNIDANSDFVVTTLVNTSGQVNLAGTTITVTDLAASTLGNVTYDGATAQQVITGTYAALILSGAGTKTASGNITASSVKNEAETEVTGDLAVSGAVESTKSLTVGGAYSATSTTNSSDLKVSGDFSGGTVDNTGAMTLSGATNTADAGSTLGDVTYNGAGDQAIIAGDYGDLTINSIGKATANGDLTAATTTNSSTLDVNGNFAGGTVNNTGSMTLSGASNTGTGTLGNVTYDGADQQVIAGTYGDLTINSTGKATATGDVSAATVDNNANTEVTGNLTTTGDLESTAALKIGGSVESANITTTGEMEVADNLTATGTVDSDASLTVGGNLTAATTDNSSDLTVSGNYSADTTTTSGTLEVSGNFAGGAVTNTSAMTLSGASNTANAGSTLGDVTYNGTADQEVIAGTYEDLVISTSGNATANGDISAATVKNDAETAITGNLTATGNITSNGDMDVTGDLTATGDLASTAALTVGGNASANNATLSGDTAITGNLTATGSITSNGDMDVTGNLTATGDLASTAALTVGGDASANNATLSGDTAITGDLTTTGDLASTAALTIGGNASANNATLSGETTITGDLTATGTVDSDAALTVGGNLIADTADNSSDLKVTGNLTANTTNNSGTLDAEGDLDAGALTNSGSISVAGAFATTSTDLGAVEYDGAADQNVVGGTYSDLSLNGGDKSLAGAVTVTDSLTADANIDTAGQDLTISGDVAGSGTISTTTDSGTVTYDGADQNILAGAYNNLALANGTKTLNSTASTTVNDTFTANGTTIQSDAADVLASLTVKDAGDDSTPSSAIAGTSFNGIALNNTGSADGYLYVNADTNNADDATTGVYLVGNVFVAANGIIYGDTLGEVCITVTNGNGDVISEGTADELGWTWAVGNDAIENATTGTAYELVSKAGYKFRFHGDVDVVIGKRAITVKADDLTIDTGDDPEFTYTYVGELVGSDAFTGELASEGDGSQPGDFAITQGTLSLGDNYDLTFIGGTLTVEGGGQDAHQFPNYNNPGNFAGVYDAPVHSTTHSYDHHESVPTLEHQNDRSIGFLFSVSNKQLGDASGAFGDSAPKGASVNIHAHTLSDLLKSYDKSEQIIASPANEIEDAQDDMKDLHDFSNNPFGILPDDEDLHTRAYDESIDFTVIGEDNLSTAKAEQFKDEFDAALEELLTLA